MRLVTDRAAQVVSRHDYLPFGEEIYAGQAGRDGSYGAADSLAQRFTGQERDGETVPNLDYFSARYYSGEQGRFLSVDPSDISAGSDKNFMGRARSVSPLPHGGGELALLSGR